MEIFDKRFVHFMWDDELEGKKVFVADNMNSLIERVEKGTSIYKVHWSRDKGMPFESDDLVRYRFAYYDENYEWKKAFNEGKKVQYQLVGGVDWADIDSDEALECRIAEGRTFRIKPEEKEETKDKNKMNPIQQKKMRRYNLKVKNWDELKEMAVKMFKEIATLNERFAKKISEGEFVTQDDWKEMNGLWQTFNYTNDDKKFCKEDLHHLFTDDLDEEFVEIKAEEAKEKKKYRPYESSAEMIADFIDRFNVICTSFCEPLIWVKRKDGVERVLIIKFGEALVALENDTYWDMEELLEQYTYLDGSPCGMEVKG